MSAIQPTVVWFRKDLRLDDHPALLEAAKTDGPVIPIYIDDDQETFTAGAASRWWLHHSLVALNAHLQKQHNRLYCFAGAALPALRSVIGKTGARAVYWNRLYEPEEIARDAHIKKQLMQEGVEVRTFNGELMYEPWEIANQQDKPYQVFTPFWKACLKSGEPAEPLNAPGRLRAYGGNDLEALAIDELNLLPETDWAAGLRKAWKPGEKGAWEVLDQFLDRGLRHYKDGRDFPSESHTSKLSPHLHFGEISPRRVMQSIQETSARGTEPGLIKGSEVYIRELGWREFGYHLLYHFPHTVDEPLRPEFKHFPWRRDAKALRAWQKGLTGYPIIDAGMRELWHTGWMHNRVRMIVASFLVKDLLISWREGERWFWDTLVDADRASNTLGWQWAGGCGADAAPYFRVFNPYLQGVKFDKDGTYVRRWVPELALLPSEFIHKPIEAPILVLKEAGVVPGETYPKPMVDHMKAKDRALEAYDVIKRTKDRE